MIASLLLFAAWQASLEQPVQFTSSGASVAAIIEDLSAQTGVALSSTDDAEKTIMILHTADRPLKEVMDRIAQASYSRWQADGDAQKLVPDEPLRRRQEAALIAKKVRQRDLIVSDIKETIELLKESEDEESKASIAGLEAWVSIYQAVDTHMLASMKANERIVFSSRPTRRQKPLPNIQSAISFFSKEVNTDYGDYPGYTYEENGEDLNRMREIAAKYMFDFEYRKGEVAKTLLIAQAAEYSPTSFPIMEVQLYDRQGLLLGSFSQGDFAGDYIVDMEPDPKAAAATEKITKQLEQMIAANNPPQMPDWWTEVAMEASRHYRELENDTDIPQTQFSPETLDRIAHPTQYDPIGLLFGEALVEFGRHTGQPIAAVLPESQVLFTTKPDPWTTVYDWFSYAEGYYPGYSGDWLIVQPFEPSVYRDSMVDRQALEKLIESRDEFGNLTYDAIAKFSLTTSADALSGLAMSLAQMAFFHRQHLDYTWAQDADMGWNVLRFYGSLSAGQQNSLKLGQSVPIQALGAEARAILETMIYGSDASISRVSAPDKQEFIRAYGDFAFHYMIGDMIQHGDYRDEPTEAAPNGIEQNGSISAQLVKIPVVVPGELIGTEFEWDEMQTLEEYEAESVEQYARPSLFMRLGEREELRLTINVSRAASPTYTLRSERITDTKVYHLTQLPESYQKARERAIADVERVFRAIN